MRRHVNAVGTLKLWPVWDIAIRFVTPIMLATILGGALLNEFGSRYEGYSVKALLFIGGGILVSTRLAAFALSHIKWSNEQLEKKRHEPDEDHLLV